MASANDIRKLADEVVRVEGTKADAPIKEESKVTDLNIIICDSLSMIDILALQHY